MKKLLSAILVVCIFFSLGIVSAYAAAEHQIADAASLESAIGAASDGDTLVLTADITLDRNITLDKELNLKSNGKTIYLGSYSISPVIWAEDTINFLDEAHLCSTDLSQFACSIGFPQGFFPYSGKLGYYSFDINSRTITENDEPNSYGLHIVPVPELPKFPTANISSNPGAGAPDLTFAMRFSNPEKVSYIQAEYFSNWKADFVVTVNKDVKFNTDITNADAYLAGNYGSYGWISVPFSDVDYTANTLYALMTRTLGNTLTVLEVYGGVQVFDCGIFFTEEFMAANPGLKATVELRVFGPNSSVENGTTVASGTFELAPPVSLVPATDDNSHAVLWAILLVMFTATAVISGKKRLTKS